jgi:arabinogalactan oligomer/maltooligosaccharide transport system permease protein
VAQKSETLVDTGASGPGPHRPVGGPPRGRPWARAGSASPVGLILKTVLLGLLLAIAVYAAFPLVEQGSWGALALLVAVTALLFWIYLSPRRIPLKYLIPGTIFLVALQIYPVLYTMSTAFTNFGDAHRGTKEQAVNAIEGASVKQVPGSALYQLTIATDGPAATGDIVFLLAEEGTRTPFVGTADGLEPLSTGDITRSDTGRITRAEGYTILTIAEVVARDADIVAFSVPTEDGAIRGQGLSLAFEGEPQQRYDSGCDCVRDTESGRTWTADDDQGLFINENGENLAQGWKVNVGFQNFVDVLTDPVIGKYFLRILAWNFAFALLTVAITFGLGLLMALVLNHERLRGQRIYRSLMILPYAMPAFAMYLVWRDMFNTDFGLVNRILGVEINWFGRSWTAMLAILLVQLWLGYSYMFLVCTGALQAIPADLKEAAAVDGARPFYAFRTVTFPLLLVAVAPLLIASFAFNFNNFNAIQLVSEGGPFPPDNPQAGGTDLLITYTYRIAFGAQGAQYGLAAAISVFIFLIVAVISIVSFRRTHVLEEIN